MGLAILTFSLKIDDLSVKRSYEEILNLVLTIKQKHFVLSWVNESLVGNKTDVWKSADCHLDIRKMSLLFGMSHLTHTVEVICSVVFQENVPLVFSDLIHDSHMII